MVTIVKPRKMPDGTVTWEKKQVLPMTPEERERIDREQLAVWKHTYRND